MKTLDEQEQILTTSVKVYITSVLLVTVVYWCGHLQGPTWVRTRRWLGCWRGLLLWLSLLTSWIKEQKEEQNLN